MDLDEELEQVRKLCHTKVLDSRLVTCTREIVRVEISKSREKTVAVILKFPEDYPNHELLVELRSKTLDDKLTNGLEKICEDEAKKYLGEPQILLVLKFITKFIDENPLCCCSKEISTIKRNLLNDSDVIKLKQKTSSISLLLKEGAYYFNCNLLILHDYPESAVKIEVLDSNFPKSFCHVFIGHANEISRRCVEPPLNKKRIPANAAPFKPKPSLLGVAQFLIEHIHRYPMQKCPVCELRCFPENPNGAIHDEHNDFHIERILCGHLWHLKCLTDYLKTPPFTGGKKCLVCNERICHEKYKVTPELAEARWAHQQARDRELEEVVDFLA